jgi:hypothetical protein
MTLPPRLRYHLETLGLLLVAIGLIALLPFLSGFVRWVWERLP